MYDFIEEYFLQVIVGILIISVWIIFISPSSDNWSQASDIRTVAVNISETNTWTMIAPIVEKNIKLSPSTEKADEKTHISEKSITVIRVIDGDTIDIWLDANIRILGIDAPESSSIRYGHTECDGSIASAYTRDILLGKQIRIEKDTIQPEQDKYGRYLLHIWIDDQLFSEMIISDGYAKQYTKALNKYSPILASSESIARSKNRGLWRDCK
jgi:endonuclease YncB( thermonuclease family)